jgi:hypothetical protein
MSSASDGKTRGDGHGRLIARRIRDFGPVWSGNYGEDVVASVVALVGDPGLTDEMVLRTADLTTGYLSLPAGP